ncbi:MAG: YqcC family protein [Pseudomonadota bacterium]
MPDTRDALIAVTDSIEAELKRIELWASEPPSELALASEEPFCYDTLDFSNWMQWVFLPRMREALGDVRDMPDRSNIHAYAEEVLRSSPQQTDQLLFLIKTFDELVAAGSSALLPAVHQSSSKKLLS